MTQVLVVAVLVLPASVLAAKPSFDCAKATARVEQLVCRDDALAKLDWRMVVLFRKAEESAPGERARIALRDAQRAWPQKRNACGRSADLRACTLHAYRARISELQVQSGEARSPMATLYDCGRLGTASVHYYLGTELPVAALSFGVGQQELAVAGSPDPGAAYEGPRHTLRNDGARALVSPRGQPDVVCARKA
ncbi:MAG: hypothetical protein IT519_03390 [Burkholderiales bacterium]|nr:hypothetical protein [Burkholderiales bacterium]